MVHANLKPAHIHSVPWFKSKKLVARTKWRDGDERGLPVSLTTATDDDWPDWDSLEAVDETPDRDVAGKVRGDALAALGLR